MINAMKFDVVIVSKGRYHLLFNQVHRIKQRCPHGKIIVVDSNKIIPSIAHDFYQDEGIDLYHTPDAKLGYARQRGVLAVTTPYFLMLDDDIIFSRGLTEKLHSEMIRYGPRVFAMSPVILFGSNEALLKVYRRKKRDTEGASSGACMISKKILNDIGGFNKTIHIGEDAELFYRAKRYGFRWIRKHNIFVHHPGTDVDFIFRTWRHREGITTSVAYGYYSYQGLIIKRIKDMFLNLLSLVKHRDIEATMLLMSNDFIAILAFIRGIIGGKGYALHKKKII